MLIGALLAAVTGTAVAAPAGAASSTGTCTAPVQRKEWRTLSDAEKVHFLLSVKCLMESDSILQDRYPASTSRYEDFLAIHQEQTPFVHWAGQFLPWHRGFLQDYEDALRNECGYTGGLPYWNTALDFLNLAGSPVLSGPLSFGGNGVGDVVVPPGGPSSDGNCVVDGFFANMTVNIAQGAGPAQPVVPGRCVLRYVRDDFGAYWMAPDKVDIIMAQQSFETFAPVIEGDMAIPNPFPVMGLHTGGHATIGGDMSDMFTSNADPLFYLFHANLDRLWAKWQAEDPAARQYDVGNPIAPRGPIQMWPNPPAGNVTLDYVLSPLKVGGSAAFTTVGQVMNTKGKGVPSAAGKPAGVLCFEYVE